MDGRGQEVDEISGGEGREVEGKWRGGVGIKGINGGEGGV